MRMRTVYSSKQVLELEKEFHYSHFPTGVRRTELAHTLGADREANQDLVSKQKDEVKEGAQRGENGGGPGYVSLLPISQLNAGDVHAVAQWWGKQHPVIQVPTIDDATLVQY